MPIFCIESQYPPHKNIEVLEAWVGAIQKDPQPGGERKGLK